MDQLKKRLLKWKQNNNLTDQQIAEKLGQLSRASINNWLRDKNPIPKKVRPKIEAMIEGRKFEPYIPIRARNASVYADSDELNKRSTKLTFLLNQKKLVVGFWTYERALKFQELMKPYTYEFVAKKLGASTVNIRNFYHECRRAAKAGYTLEKMFKENQPFRIGKKILA